jgi:hypothetical protein
MWDPALEILGHELTPDFNVQPADSDARLLPNSVSESANLTVPLVERILAIVLLLVAGFDFGCSAKYSVGRVDT